MKEQNKGIPACNYQWSLLLPVCIRIERQKVVCKNQMKGQKIYAATGRQWGKSTHKQTSLNQKFAKNGVVKIMLNFMTLLQTKR